MVRQHALPVATMSKGCGENRLVAGSGLVRYWHGGAAASRILAHGASVVLPAGEHRAVFHYRTRAPRAEQVGHWGTFSLWQRGQGSPIVEAAVARREADGFVSQRLTFTLAEATRVEPRIIAGDAELWVQRVSFGR